MRLVWPYTKRPSSSFVFSSFCSLTSHQLIPKATVLNNWKKFYWIFNHFFNCEFQCFPREKVTSECFLSMTTILAKKKMFCQQILLPGHRKKNRITKYDWLSTFNRVLSTNLNNKLPQDNNRITTRRLNGSSSNNKNQLNGLAAVVAASPSSVTTTFFRNNFDSPEEAAAAQAGKRNNRR